MVGSAFCELLIASSVKCVNLGLKFAKFTYMYHLGLIRIVYFDIRIFFNFQTNSPNILLHIKVVK